MLCNMETLSVNITGDTRREEMAGRKYIVAPLSLIVPGVLNGSQGPLLYTAEQIQKSENAWNGMPIVKNHPVDNDGNPISARSPEVYKKSLLGYVFESNAENGLGAEGWFDIEKTREVDDRILNSIEAGEVIELSTGLFTETDWLAKGKEEHFLNEDGTSEKYVGITKNYKPDHLAILPDDTGACSIKKGCGVMVKNQDEETKTLFNKFVAWIKADSEAEENNNESDVQNNADDQNIQEQESMITEKKKELVENLVANCSCWSEDDREVLNGFDETKLEKLQPKAVETPEEKPAEKPVPLENAAPKTLEEFLVGVPHEVSAVITNAMNAEQKQKDQLISELTANLSDDAKKAHHTKVLNSKSVSDLQDMIELMPAPAKQTNFFGANSGTESQTPEMVDNSAQDDSDISDMIPPTINFEDVSKETSATA